MFLSDTSIFTDQTEGAPNQIKYLISSVDEQGQKSGYREKVIILNGAGREKEINPGYLLLKNYPNPFNPETKIIYHLEEAANIRVVIYNMNGEIMEEPLNEYQERGWHSLDYRMRNPGKDISSGIYIYSLEVRKRGKLIYTGTGKMVYLK